MLHASGVRVLHAAMRRLLLGDLTAGRGRGVWCGRLRQCFLAVVPFHQVCALVVRSLLLRKLACYLS